MMMMMAEPPCECWRLFAYVKCCPQGRCGYVGRMLVRDTHELLTLCRPCYTHITDAIDFEVLGDFILVDNPRHLAQ